MGITNLPAIVKNTSLAVKESRSGLPAVAQAASNSASGARIVGYSAAGRSTVTKESLATAIKAVKPTSRFMNKKVVIGGSAVAVSALAGMGVEELIQKLDTATPDEMRDLVMQADDDGAVDVADASSEVYNNMTFVDRASLQPSQDDKNVVIKDNIERSGIGLDVHAVDRQQALMRAYRSIRGSLTYDDIWTLRVLITTATDQDLMALEDLYRG